MIGYWLVTARCVGGSDAAPAAAAAATVAPSRHGGCTDRVPRRGDGGGTGRPCGSSTLLPLRARPVRRWYCRVARGVATPRLWAPLRR